MSQNPITFFPLHAEFASHVPLDWFESALLQLFKDQQGLYWWIGDVMIALEKKYPSDVAYQAIPEGMSLGMCQRCKAVAEAYPPKDRNPLATWSTHMQLAKRADRVAAVAATVEAGQNTDDVKRSPPPPQVQEAPAEPPKEEAPAATKRRYLLAVDLNYYVHSFFNNAQMDAARSFSRWMYRLLTRMQTYNGLTDAVMCVDAPTNFRKALTAHWEKPYKDRGDKEPELVKQIALAQQMMQKMNVTCVWIEDMEADDVMASYAAQFDGVVSLMTADKDLRQCLSGRVNILYDTSWVTQEDSGNKIPKSAFITAKQHFEDGLTYQGAEVKGIKPEMWAEFQALAGDSGDKVPGIVGVGGKIAMELLEAHGNIRGVLDAHVNKTLDLPAKLLLATEEFRHRADLMLRLTTMRTDLPVPKITTLNLRDPNTQE